MNFSRKSQINLLEQNNEYDLLVIGGGVVGSAILELAASKGISAILLENCLLYTSPSPRDYAASRMPSSA